MLTSSRTLNRRSLLASAGALAAVGCTRPTTGGLAIGWQTPLATQGQIAAILQRSEVLAHNSLTATFAPFSFGTPQMEAARAGAINVALVGDQPLVNLICSGAPWRILSRLFDTRVVLFRNRSRRWDGPRGKTFAAPQGSVAHREMVAYQRSQGLDAAQQHVRNIFVDAAEIGALVGRGQDWGEIDVIAIWEPLASRIAATEFVEEIYSRKTLGLVGVSGEIAANADQVRALRETIKNAWQVFLSNPNAAHDWYRQLASIESSNDELTTIARLDRNFATNQPSITLTDDDKSELAKSIQWSTQVNPQFTAHDVDSIIVP